MIFREEMIPDLENFLKLYYYKIVRFNSITGEYELILQNGNSKPHGNTIQEWLDWFIAEGNVHPDDIELVREKGKLENLPNDEILEFSYRRKMCGDYYESQMIVIPSVEHEEIFYLFVKAIELA